MKKIVSFLLTFSMVLCLASCGENSEETTKKKKKTKKTTTEITETETPTEDPSDSSEDPSSDTSETSGNVMGGQFEISHELTSLDVYVSTYYHIYGALDPNGDFEFGTKLNYVKVDADIIDFYYDHDGPQEIQDMMQKLDDETFYALMDYTNIYTTEAAAFAEVEKKGGPLYDYSYGNHIELFRADSQLVSYVSEIYQYDSREPGTSLPVLEAHNLRVSDGMAIQYDEVVIDREALASYVQERYSQDYVLDDVLAQIRDGSLPFGILYDGIYIYSIDAKIPYIGNEDALSAKYFGKVPDYYTLYLNGGKTLTWDVNNDGALDDLRVSQANSESFTIELNSKEYTFSAENIEELPEFYIYDGDDQYVMFTETGTYLVMTLHMDDDDRTFFCIFAIEGDNVTYCSKMFAALSDVHNPNYLKVNGYYDVLGFTGASMRCSIHDGYPCAFNLFGDVCTSAYEVKVDLKGYKFDHLTMDTTDEVTIKKGSKVTICYYAEETGELILRVLDPNDLNEYDVAVKAEANNKINGYPVDDALIGVLYAG